VFFPDPWPKSKHHKRRLINAEFAALVAPRLSVGGELLVATDWEHYAHAMRVVLDAEPLLENLAGQGQFANRNEERPTTRFEARGVRLGHRVWDLAYRKREVR
jgi:tRNA (guanine-N7-)-methyltransferase